MLFENFIVTECLKNCFNHVKNSNLYFFRDHAGHEIDLILDYGHALYSVEIKSAETIHPDFLKGLDFYHQLAEKKNTKRFILYGGKDSYEMNGVKIYGYKHLEDFFSDIAK